MKWTNLIPASAKPLLRPMYEAFIYSSVYRKIKHRPKKRNELHQYWKEADDVYNHPQKYLEGEERSQFAD